MSKNDAQLAIPLPDDWASDPDAKPLAFGEANKKYELFAPHQIATNLVGETFTILSLKRIESDKPGPGYYYFLACVDLESGEKFTATLGGEVVLQKLNAYMQASAGEPLTVTLVKREGGEFGGYYDIE